MGNRPGFTYPPSRQRNADGRAEAQRVTHTSGETVEEGGVVGDARRAETGDWRADEVRWGEGWG